MTAGYHRCTLERKKNNTEVRKRRGQPTLENILEISSRVRWLGRVTRMNENSNASSYSSRIPQLIRDTKANMEKTVANDLREAEFS